MDEINVKDEVLSEVVQSLESEQTFQEIVNSISENVNRYLKADGISLLQISADGKKLETVIHTEGINDKVILSNVSVDKFKLAGSELRISYIGEDGKGHCYSISEPDKECENSGIVTSILNQLGVTTFITVPIHINGIKAMYFVVSHDKGSYECSRERVRFVKDVSKLIQSIAQRKVTKNSLLSSYEVLKSILSSIGSGIIVCNRSTGNILFENDVASGCEEIRDSIKESLEELFASEDMEERINYAVERYNTDSGLWFEIKFSELTWIDGSPVIVCTALDITQKKKNQQKIEYQAHNDFLTGLYNRMKCEGDLRRIIKNTVKQDKKGAVLFIDLDNFKHINDGLGHQYGDILLQQIAAGLQSIPGLRDHCYRMGGDEFVVIVTPENYESLDRITTNIKAMFNKPWYLMETEYFCTMSMGIAVFPDDSRDVHEITRMADVAMYEAKKGGKNGFTYYSDSEQQNTAKRLDIENSMRQAIATDIDEFVVFYQPVVDVITEECASCEALVRWDSKSLGFMAPGDFIPLAEYLGLITSIGDYVLEEACLQCKYWNDNGHPDFRINVNLSVVQLLQKDVVDVVKRTLEKTGVNPSNIVLEITESFAINDMDRVLTIIKGLKELGPKIALDDFGTGYSSLNYIKQLPLDIIKVDKTFIDDIVEDDYAQAFVKLIVDLSKTIGSKIVVEGVEHKEQLDILKELGVDYIQGYYYGKPVPSNEFEEINFRGRNSK